MRTQGLLLLAALLITAGSRSQTQDDSLQTIPAPPGRSFTIKESDGAWWLVDPAGDRFFSRGVCCVNPGLGWSEYSTANPGYAAWHHFPEASAWAAWTIDTLRAWGFTTIGGWSDIPLLDRSSRTAMPFTAVLHMGIHAGAPWWDMWDKNVVDTIERIARERMADLKERPNRIGYYSDNELGWWNDALWEMTWEHQPGSGARQRLVQLLRTRYHDDWSALLADFDPENATDFDSLEHGGKLYLRGGSRGVTVIKKFVSLIAERYYSLMDEILHRLDPEALYLGDRYLSFYYPEVAAAAAPYVDAISTNFNAQWNDGTTVRYFLATLHELSRKPVMITEFYMAAMENRSGNRNNSAAFPTVTTQEERVAGFLTTARLLTRTPWVIGADWFQYYDEPMHGRDDGENFNMGLIDIYGQPYAGLTAGARSWAQMAHGPALDSPAKAVPPAPACIVDSMSILKNWDRPAGFIPALTPAPTADLYLCWRPEALYMALCAEDVVEKRWYRDKTIPEADRMALTVTIKEQTIATLRLGGGRPTAAETGGAEVLYSRTLPRTLRHYTILRLPAGLWGRAQLKPGDRTPCAVELQTLARAHTIHWQVKSRL